MSKRGFTYGYDDKNRIEVWQNGELKGHITPSLGGHRFKSIDCESQLPFQYGDIYNTPAEVMRTLEEE